jgi:hypothetical protein
VKTGIRLPGVASVEDGIISNIEPDQSDEQRESASDETPAEEKLPFPISSLDSAPTA